MLASRTADRIWCNIAEKILGGWFHITLPVANSGCKEQNERSKVMENIEMWLDALEDGYGEVLDAQYGGQEF